MPTTKRVHNVVSNYQEEEAAAGDGAKPAGCGRSCLSGCCLPASELPLYNFNINSRTQDSASSSSSAFFLHSLLFCQWEDRMARGLFRYNVTACETKLISGERGFVAQLNEGRRLKKRPTEFRADQVLQPFDPSKFNFAKAGQEEALLRFEPGDDGAPRFFRTAPVNSAEPINVILINVSPIEYGHVLLVPRLLECLPQRIDHESFLLALHLVAEAANPYFRVGYNSLGAFATINHLHFQAYFLAVPLPVEKARTRTIPVVGLENGVKVSELSDYPVRGLVFEGGSTLNELADIVVDRCVRLQENNIPFNVLVSDVGRRVFLFPQCYAERQARGEVSQELLDTQVNPASWEISGHMVLKRRKDFDEASEESACRLLAEVSLSKERFHEVKAFLFEGCRLPPSEEQEDDTTEDEDKFLTPSLLATPLEEGCLVFE